MVGMGGGGVCKVSKLNILLTGPLPTISQMPYFYSPLLPQSPLPGDHMSYEAQRQTSKDLLKTSNNWMVTIVLL